MTAFGKLAEVFVSARATGVALPADFKKIRTQVGAQAAGLQAQLSGLGAAGVAGGGIFAGLFGKAGAAIVTALGLKIAGDFEQIMIAIRANMRLLGDQFDDTFSQIEQVARELGATTRFTATEAARAMNILALAGFDVNQVMKATPQILELAAAAEISLAQAADFATKSMFQFQLQVEDITRINDTLASVQTRTNSTIIALAQALAKAGALAKVAGLEIEDVASAMGLMIQAGSEGVAAGTAFSLALFRLSSTSALGAKAATAALSRIGKSFDDFADANGNIKQGEFFNLLAALQSAGLGLKDLSEIFGARGKEIVKLFAAMDKEGRKGLAAMAALAKGVRGDVGIAAEIAAAKMSTFFGSLRKALSAVQELTLSIVGPLLGAFNLLFIGIAVVFRSIAKLNEVLFGIPSTIIAIAIAVKIVIPALLFATASLAGMTLRAVAFLGIGKLLTLMLLSWKAPFIAANALIAGIGVAFSAIMGPFLIASLAGKKASSVLKLALIGLLRPFKLFAGVIVGLASPTALFAASLSLVALAFKALLVGTGIGLIILGLVGAFKILSPLIKAFADEFMRVLEENKTLDTIRNAWADIASLLGEIAASFGQVLADITRSLLPIILAAARGFANLLDLMAGFLKLLGSLATVWDATWELMGLSAKFAILTVFNEIFKQLDRLTAAAGLPNLFEGLGLQDELDETEKRMGALADQIQKAFGERAAAREKPPPEVEEGGGQLSAAGGFRGIVDMWRQTQEALLKGDEQKLQKEANQKLGNIDAGVERLNENLEAQEPAIGFGRR